MSTLSIGRFGFAFGMTGTILYLGCVLLMLTLPRETTVTFFNSLMHGVDVEPLMRWDMPWWQMCLGVIQTFILGWFIGTMIASLYNVSGSCNRESNAR